MSEQEKDHIAFDVETERVLQILSTEIYDSPKALLRENVQNAYDAVLMRCTAAGEAVGERKIEITIDGDQLIVRDDGIGMTEDVLRRNFWKAGSSGKKTELAQRSGVIGTFGIGAMANFGVCTALRVETRHLDSNVTLISSARRADLRIAENCIDLERVSDERAPGTVIVAEMDPASAIDEASAIEYLKQYVQFVPVPVIVNGNCISQRRFEDALEDEAAGYVEIAERAVTQGEFAATLRTYVNQQGKVLARLESLSLQGNLLAGEALFVQHGGQTLGFRNLFGLAPIPVSGYYDFGGFVNLEILHPTAGREALSRDSIQHVTELVAMVEAEVSKDVADGSHADTNQQFQQYILARGLVQLANNLKITVLPARDGDVTLGDVKDYEPDKERHFYPGRDATVLQRFASDRANLFHVSQSNPRRKLQLRYLREFAALDEVPENIIVDPIPPTELSLAEAMCLMRIRGVLLDEYFIAEAKLSLARISHGVSVQVDNSKGELSISLARDMSALQVVVTAYETAKEALSGFVTDFVREHIYPRIREHVPSSTRQGRDALYQRLKQNEELFRYEFSDLGEAESLLADYLSGKADLDQVLRSSGGHGGGQRQELRRDQVGSVEEELPDIVGDAAAASDLEAAPPIVRTEVSSTMKVLVVGAEHSKLNGFRLFLALSDRMAKCEGEFLRQPHTTKLMWGTHRVIYVFSNATGDLNLYYDIKLREPLDTETTGGDKFPTTTIITKNRIYVPVPSLLKPAFQIGEDGVKEFFVRFDTIP